MKQTVWIVLMAALTGANAMAQSGDHLIVPGMRIGAADLAPADQGALFRELGAPNRTDRNGDLEIYRYGAAPSGTDPDELVVEFDLVKDAPFEISTASPLYRTRDGLGVGSSAAAVEAHLGPPVCETGDAGKQMLVYDSIRFLLARGRVAKVSIRDAGSGSC